MFRDPLVQKAWEMREQAECFPIEVILKATFWLEERYQQTPEAQTAIAIALQYMVLAMRRAHTSPMLAREYLARALLWRDDAARCLTKRSPAVAPPQSH